VEPSFIYEEPKDKEDKKGKKKKYLPNPQPNWGPKARATGNK